MTAATGFLCGALAAFGSVCTLGVYLTFMLSRHPQHALSALAALIRMFSAASGFKSVVIADDGKSRVVAFEDVAHAIDRGELLTRIPVRVHRSEPPPASPLDEHYHGKH